MTLVALVAMLCVPLTSAWEPGDPGQGLDPCENLDPKGYWQAWECYLFMMLEIGWETGQFEQW